MKHECKAECVAGWGPSRRCHCSACGASFSVPANFDKHRTVNGECVNPATKGLTTNKDGIWIKEGEGDPRFTAKGAEVPGTA